MKLPERPPYKSSEYDYAKILFELVGSGKFHEFLRLNESHYYYYNKWKFIAKEWGFDPKKLWYAVKQSRSTLNTIWLKPEPNFAFEIRVPSIIQRHLHEFDMHLGGALQGNIIPTEDKDRYLISSLMEEAIASSQLEGAATTRKVAKEMLENNRAPKTHSEQMIVNNYQAMKWIVANKNAPFTLQNIRHLHSILTSSTMANEEESGAFRQDDDIKVVDTQTGDTLYTPPSWELLEELMEQYCLLANDEIELYFFLHPILKGILLHFMMGYIHPFADGNGRTARTIFYWYLLRKGYWLVEYMSVSRIILGSKAQYARAYLHTELDNNDMTYFFVYNLECMQQSLEELKKHIARKNAEKQQVISLLRSTSFNDRQVALIQEMMQDATIYFTVQQVEIKFNVSNQTARNDLQAMVEKGILQTRKSGHKVQYLPVPNYMHKITAPDND